MKKEMGESEQKIYEYIKKYITEHMYAPSIREIGDAVGLKSTSSVDAQLKNLRNRGYIEFVPYTPRAIRLIGYKVVKDEERE